MKKWKALTLLLWIELLLLASAAGQELWPGDINDNGVVNGVDVLFWGQAFGNSGPQRPGGNTAWTGQSVGLPWARNFANGLNYAYADANGDGIVDGEDLDDAIEPNFFLTHGLPQPDGYANGNPGSTTPRLLLTPNMTLVEEGAAIEVDLRLGSPDQPIANFYGIALAMHYDAGLVREDEGFDFVEAPNSWIAADGAPREYFFFEDPASGRAELAITRLNQTSLAGGSGSLGKFSIVIEDIIVGLSVDTFRLQIDSVLLIDHQFNTFPVVPDSTEIIVAKDSSLVSLRPPVAEAIARVYPNPAGRICRLQYPGNLTALKLLDQMGREYPLGINGAADPGNFQLMLPAALPPGLFFLRGNGSAGPFVLKIIIHP